MNERSKEMIYQERKHLETKFQTLAKLHFDNANNYKMLLLGVLLGLLGGLFATLLYELVIKHWQPEPQWMIFILVSIMFAYFIWRCIKEMSSSHKKGLQVKQDRDGINLILDSLTNPN